MTAFDRLKALCMPDEADELRPWLDRSSYRDYDTLWVQNGFHIREPITLQCDRVVPDTSWLKACDKYAEVREQARCWEREATPYMKIPELMDLCCHLSLSSEIHYLIGEAMGVHLNLCGWTTTERDWHSDGYLSGRFVHDYYCAAWIALEDIHPDSGPFEYVPGTHKWPRLDQEKVQRELLRRKLTTIEKVRDGSWPWDSEKLLTPLFEESCRELGLKPQQFIAKKGEVLIWHPRLWHRGSPAKVKGMERRAIIAHYSGIYHRPDFPKAVQHKDGGWYFPIISDTQHPMKG